MTKAGLSVEKDQAWLLVFLPSLLYFFLSRTTTIFGTTHYKQSGILSGILGSTQYLPVTTTLVLSSTIQEESEDRKILLSNFFIKGGKDIDTNQPIPLLYPVETIIYASEETPTKFHSTTYVHDGELERGYLLISDTFGSGRIWKWEVGGGPITIGRSLHQVNSGCRSRSKCSDEDGSRGIAVQWEYKSANSQQSGHLLIIEGGEQRIVRIEKENGARTPLVINIPCGDDRVRLQKADLLLLTPHGDLIFTATASHPSCPKDAIFRLIASSSVPPISPDISREAHSWNETSHSHSVELIHGTSDGVTVSGLSLNIAKDLTAASTLYFATVTEDRVLIKALLLEEDEEQNTEEMVYDMTSYFTMKNIHLGTAITLDGTGNLYATHPNGVAVISQTGTLLANIFLHLNQTYMNSITLAQDGFFYMTAINGRLLRLRTRAKPVEIPTNKYRKTK